MNKQFEEMTAHYEKRLYAQAMKRLGNTMDAQDALQETFLKAWIHFETLVKCEYRGAWLMRVLINECISMHRRETSRQRVFYQVAAKKKEEAAFDENVICRMDVKHALNAMDEMKKVLLTQYLFGGVTIARLAELTGATRPAVYAQIHRGREKIRQMLAG